MEDVKLEDLQAFVDSLYKELMRSHEKRFESRIRNIKHTSDELAIVASRLEVSIRNAWGTLDKSTSEQGLRMVETIKENTNHISNETIQADYYGLESFHKSAVEVSNKIILTIRKYVPKLYKTMKTEIASLNTSLTKFEAAINEFGSSLDNSPGSEIESLKTNIQKVLDREHTLTEFHENSKEIRKALNSSIEGERMLVQEQEALHAHELFQQLFQLEDVLKSRAEAIEQFLQPLGKALKKYERLSDDKSSDHQILTQLVENPRDAVSRTDTQTLLRVFGAINEALSKGELGIEERKRKRAEEVISSITQGALDQLRIEFLSIQDRIKHTKDQLQAIGLLQKREKLTESLTRTQSSTLQLNTQLTENEKRIEDMNRMILKEKSQIEAEITRLSGKTVTIRLETYD